MTSGYRHVKDDVLRDIEAPETRGWLASHLDVFAHRLAELQRTWLTVHGYGGPCVCEGCSWCLAQDYINLIDPRAKP